MNVQMIHIFVNTTVIILMEVMFVIVSQATNNGGCDQECINQVGSYYCQCNTRYTLDEDGHGCSSQ